MNSTGFYLESEEDYFSADGTVAMQQEMLRVLDAVVYRTHRVYCVIEIVPKLVKINILGTRLSLVHRSWVRA